MNETAIDKHLTKLAVEIGARPVGSKANQEAALYIESVFAKAGLETIRQEYPCTDWKEIETFLEVNGRRFEASANWCSQGCDVTAPLVPLTALSELDGADIQGKIAVLAGEYTSEVWLPEAFKAYTMPEQKQMIATLISKAPAALVTVSPAFGKTEHLIKDEAFPIPSVTVAPEVGLRLTQNSGQSAHLRIRAERSQGTAANLVARQGDGPRLLICAHYDTVPGAPGAVDNASGVSALLALAHSLKSLPLSIEFVAFSGEELDTKGDERFLSDYGLPMRAVMDGTSPKREMEDIRLVINLDGIGQRLGVDTIACFNTPSVLTEKATELAKQHGISVVEPWPMSNHYTFCSYRVPAIALSSTGVTNLSHGPRDTLEWVDPNRIQAVVGLVEALAASLLEKVQDIEKT